MRLHESTGQLDTGTHRQSRYIGREQDYGIPILRYYRVLSFAAVGVAYARPQITCGCLSVPFWVLPHMNLCFVILLGNL
jgi:hypothetical protein